MRMSQLFSRTLRDVPTEAEIVSHQLLLRAGYIRQLAAGIFTAMPLAKRTITKIETIIREEMNAIGGQEITMPVVHPAELWQETGRWYQIGSEMGRFKDKNDRDMVLAMTHEEVVADLVRKEIRSYRQLPTMIYHLQTKWRDDPRPRAGLIRVREFTMKDSYSLDADWDGLDKQYRAHYQAYFNIFNRCGLPAVAVGSDVGMMGGSLAHEYMYLNPIGEDTLMICDNCHYAANRQIANFRKPAAAQEALPPLEKVATPDTKTIEALAQLLNVPKSKTAKAVFMVATIPDGEQKQDKFIFAIVRGDMDVNETKLGNAVKASDLRPAREEEITAIGAVPGYASPIGITAPNMIIVVDDAVMTSPNLVAGANDAGYHLLNTNVGRDYTPHIVADITAAREGDACPRCGSPLTSSRGVEIGNIFKLGTRYTEALGATFLDKDGERKPVIMGSYGIGVGRLLACVAEEYNDADGLIWPISIAPYHVHLVQLATEGETTTITEQLYRDLQAAGVEVLLDDREETPGVKFKDADLIGLPIRVTVGERALKRGGPEIKLRRDKAPENVAVDQLVARVQTHIAALRAELAARVVTVPFES